jgi:hypothetical protein
MGLHVKYRLFWSDFNDKYHRKILEKYSNIKFNKNLPSGSRDVSCKWRKVGRTDMMKATVAFRNFANASKNCKNNIRLTARAMRLFIE